MPEEYGSVMPARAAISRSPPARQTAFGEHSSAAARMVSRRLSALIRRGRGWRWNISARGQ